MLPILLALTALAGVDPDVARIFPSPAWDPAPDETPAPASPVFQPCEALIRLAEARGSRVTDARYSLSPRWGKIVRVRSVADDGADTASHLTCWFKTGRHDVHFLYAPEQTF
jgi:hypothetical protein